MRPSSHSFTYGTTGIRADVPQRKHTNQMDTHGTSICSIFSAGQRECRRRNTLEEAYK